MSDDKIPLDWVRGPEEVTVWLWTNTANPYTVRFPLRNWAKIERTAEQHFGGDIQAYVTQVIGAELSEHKQVMGTKT